MHASEPEVAPAVSKCTDTFAVRSTDPAFDAVFISKFQPLTA